MVSPQGKKLTGSGHFLSQKMVAVIFRFDGEVLNFFTVGECAWYHCIDCHLFSGVWRDTQVSSPVTIQSRQSAGFWIDTAILKTHCEHNVVVTVAGELCPVIRFLSHTTALPFLEKNIPLHFYWTCIFTFRIYLLAGLSTDLLFANTVMNPLVG
jgi:hypothetical protein